jgi:hypothetical protein
MVAKTKSAVGVIGLGLMGSALAERLQQAGFHVHEPKFENEARFGQQGLPSGNLRELPPGRIRHISGTNLPRTVSFIKSLNVLFFLLIVSLHPHAVWISHRFRV